MAQIVKPDILDPDMFADAIPKRQCFRQGPRRIMGRWEDMRVAGARLAFDDRACLTVQIHLPRTGLAVRKVECAVANFLPFQVSDLAATASGVRR